MKRLVIIGAGISGLSLAWFLRNEDDLEVTLLEASDRVGGSIETRPHNGFLFDLGPHSLRPSRKALAILQLIMELGLDQEMLVPSMDACKKYIYRKGTLQALPTHPLQLLRSPWRALIGSALWRDLFCRRALDEETIAQFAERRFGRQLAEQFIDPLTTGIYGADFNLLSARSCFPDWVERERRFGPLLNSFWRRESHSHDFDPKLNALLSLPLISFQGGMERLISSISKQLGKRIRYGCPAQKIVGTIDGKVHVETAEGVIRADRVISTIPSYCLAKLLCDYPAVTSLLDKICYSSFTMVGLGYRGVKWQGQGFGYLIPHEEQQSNLGVIWDSSLFPQLSPKGDCTQLTVLFGDRNLLNWHSVTEEAWVEMATEAIRKQMRWDEAPNSVVVKRVLKGIPQYRLGHEKLIKDIETELARQLPELICLGNWRRGVSVGDCVESSYDCAHSKILAKFNDINDTTMKTMKIETRA